MPNLGYETFESRWIDHPDLRDVVRDLCVGEVLNFPCGQSGIGDLKADIDKRHAPDIMSDLKHPPFERDSFDTVYCDPPYSMISSFDGSLEWVKELYKIARERLIVQGPNKALYPGSPAEQQVLCLKPKPGSTKNWIRVLQVFDHPDSTLDSFK